MNHYKPSNRDYQKGDRIIRDGKPQVVLTATTTHHVKGLPNGNMAEMDYQMVWYGDTAESKIDHKKLFMTPYRNKVVKARINV